MHAHKNTKENTIKAIECPKFYMTGPASGLTAAIRPDYILDDGLVEAAVHWAQDAASTMCDVAYALRTRSWVGKAFRLLMAQEAEDGRPPGV